MSRRAKFIVSLIVLALIFVIGGFTAVPRVVGVLPGEYRVRLARIPLMEPILEIGTTPLPTALPAPSVLSGQPDIIIPAIVLATATSLP